jgi:eukaryotic-like serine/threonine-protein kinase
LAELGWKRRGGKKEDVPAASDLERIREILGDRYEVLNPVGTGGMAKVFIARHRRHGGLVAVKVLAEELAEVPELVERFVQEARTAATLDGHPNVISIFDIGDANGTHYLLMPFLVGEDLGKYLRRNGKMSPDDSANVIAQTLHGLNWAHKKGVVHRDIKPSNLYLDQNGRIVVVDFGIAKLRDFPTLQTKANVRLGTTFYMCPEQIRGEPCDGRSDLYTLGVVFYELLTGKRPFSGTTEHEVLIGHLERTPPDLQALDASIPKPYIDIVYKLLAKNPGERYQSAEEVIAELEALGQHGVPSKIRPQIDPKLADSLKTPVPTPGLQAVGVVPDNALPQTVAAQNAPLGLVMATRVDQPASIPVPIAPSPPANIPAANVPAANAPAASVPVQKNKLLLPLGLAGAVLAAAVGAWFWVTAQKGHAPDTKTTAVSQTPGKTEPPQVIEDRFHKKMGLILAGPFVFGDDSQEAGNPKSTVTLPAFYIDLTEVTVKEYQSFCTATGRRMPPNPPHGDDLPVTNVSWDDAVAYSDWIGKRLPTEQEWEKAARGTDGLVYPWGNTPWERGSGGPPRGMVAVESFPGRRSPFQAYNMAGNAAEWVATTYPENEHHQEYRDLFRNRLNGKAFSEKWYVVKGGHFSPDSHDDVFFRTYIRLPWPEDTPSPFVGFRCAKDPSK